MFNCLPTNPEYSLFHFSHIDEKSVAKRYSVFVFNETTTVLLLYIKWCIIFPMFYHVKNVEFGGSCNITAIVVESELDYPSSNPEQGYLNITLC